MSKHDFYSSLALIRMISNLMASWVEDILDYIEDEKAYHVMNAKKITIIRRAVNSLLDEIAELKSLSKNIKFHQGKTMIINKSSIMPACFFHPLTIFFLDDRKIFLDLICSELENQEKMLTFTDPKKAIEIINSEEFNIGRNIFSLYNDIDLDSPGIKHIDLNIGNIRSSIYDGSRFNHIGVLVVDYKMPEITGVDVCRSILNRRIYKVMLTAEAGLDTAVAAFNEGVIDRFVSKTSNNLCEHLSGILCELKEKYFHDISKLILSNLDARLRDTLQTEIFIELFSNVFHESNAVEYYLLDASGSYLFLDKSGFPTWLIIRNDQDFQDQLEILSGLEASSRMKASLENRTQLLFLLDSEEYQQPVEEWESGLFDANLLTSSLWYAIAKGPIKSSIQWDRVKSYQGSK